MSAKDSARERMWRIVGGLFDQAEKKHDDGLAEEVGRLAMAMCDFEQALGFPDAYQDRFEPAGRA